MSKKSVTYYRCDHHDEDSREQCRAQISFRGESSEEWARGYLEGRGWRIPDDAMYSINLIHGFYCPEHNNLNGKHHNVMEEVPAHA